MDDRNRNLVVRITSAVLLLPLVVFLIYRGGLWSAGLMAAAAAACAAEYYLITQVGLGVGAALGIVLAALLPLWPFLLPLQSGDAAFWTLGAALVSAWVVPLVSGPLNTAPTRAAHLLTGVAYAGVGLYALSALRCGPDGLGWMIAALTLTWANDTLAYFTGRFLGRHKLYPQVSPNKTWEGFLGGFIGSVGGLFVARAVYVHALTPTDCVVLGILGGVLGPLGDLCESMLKRAYGAKDSSHLIPGHGGVLDRVDALLFNGPLLYVYVRFVRSLLGT